MTIAQIYVLISQNTLVSLYETSPAQLKYGIQYSMQQLYAELAS